MIVAGDQKMNTKTTVTKYDDTTNTAKTIWRLVDDSGLWPTDDSGWWLIVASGQQMIVASGCFCPSALLYATISASVATSVTASVLCV